MTLHLYKGLETVLNNKFKGWIKHMSPENISYKEGEKK